jgi:hypothetical protein
VALRGGVSGLVSSVFWTGAPLVYNRPDTFMPDLLICRKEWAAAVLAEVARLAN